MEHGRGSWTTSRGMWMLRSLLVLALLVPCVSALPKGVADARRSNSVESGSARDVSHSRHSHAQPREQINPLFAPAQRGHLDSTASVSTHGGKPGSRASPRLRRNAVFPSVVAVNATSANSTSSNDRTLTIVFEQTNGTEAEMTVVAPPTQRWGQTATYLPGHNVVLVVGGQTSISGDITNDVYALNVTNLASAMSNSTAEAWQRLSSEGLPAHAYAAASAVADPVDGAEKLWIVGGVTANCATDAPAYVWSAPVGNITAGKWAAVYPDNGVAPSRRRGAKAVTLGSANATSSVVMISGGTFDASTCASTNGTYNGLDLWSPSSVTLASPSPANSTSVSIETAAAAHVGVDVTGASYASIQSLALDPRMHDFSLTDYATVVLPSSNTTGGEQILFLGGKDQSGRMAPLSQFWVLDATTGDWQRWNATGLIPSGRMGHTAVATSQGKIIVHGGYLEDPSRFKTNNHPVDEVFILDPNQTPARWDAAVWTSQSTRPPALAYHSAVMAGGVMVTSFGKVSDGPVFDGQSFLANGNAGGTIVHYMDTETMQTAGGLTWSTSPAGVEQARKQVAAAAGVGAAPTSPTPAQASPAVQQTPVATPAASASASAIASSVKPSSQVAAPTSSQAATETNPVPIPISNNQSVPPASNHTGAIAGSLLGAAAIAAAIGGIYAYRKRKEAAAYNLGRQEGRFDPNDLDRFQGADEEKPYVSNLFLSDAAAVGAGAVGATGGWAGRLKRAASSLTKSRSGGGESDNHTTASPKAGGITARNGAAARSFQSEMDQEQELPDDFIASLIDDEAADHSFHRSTLVLPTADDEKHDLMMHANLSRASLATLGSTETGSAAAASHFSYPYLSAMHRGASPHSLIRSDRTSPTPSAAAAATHRVRVILDQPDVAELYLSPGDQYSPYHLPANPHASPQSDTEADDASAAAVAVATFSPARTPLFPWSTPQLAPPPRAMVASQLRSKPTILHVANC